MPLPAGDSPTPSLGRAQQVDRANQDAGPALAPNRARRLLHPMVRYALLRLGLGIALLAGVTIVTFSLTHLVPGDPVQAVLGEQASANPAIVKQFRTEMGLDRPVAIQYGIYLSNLLHGNLGISAQTRTPVATELASAFPATAELAAFAITVSVFVGVGLGLWAAVRRAKVTDHVIRVISLVGISVPTFWLALVVYYIFFFKLRLLPGTGRLSPVDVPPPHVTGMYTIDSLLAGEWGTFTDALAHLVMPASVLALFTVGLLTRFTRSSVLEVLNTEYVLAARAKGLSPTAITFRYVLRGALVPVITVVGISFGSLLSGAVLIEEVFSWHGIGQYAYQGATKLDLPVVMGVGLVVGAIFVVVNFAVDIIYGFIDPRVRTP